LFGSISIAFANCLIKANSRSSSSPSQIATADKHRSNLYFSSIVSLFDYINLSIDQDPQIKLDYDKLESIAKQYKIKFTPPLLEFKKAKYANS